MHVGERSFALALLVHTRSSVVQFTVASEDDDSAKGEVASEGEGHFILSFGLPPDACSFCLLFLFFLLLSSYSCAPFFVVIALSNCSPALF